MAWCLVKHRNYFTLLYFTLLYFTLLLSVTNATSIVKLGFSRSLHVISPLLLVSLLSLHLRVPLTSEFL